MTITAPTRRPRRGLGVACDVPWCDHEHVDGDFELKPPPHKPWMWHERIIDVSQRGRYHMTTLIYWRESLDGSVPDEAPEPVVRVIFSVGYEHDQIIDLPPAHALLIAQGWALTMMYGPGDAAAEGTRPLMDAAAMLGHTGERGLTVTDGRVIVVRKPPE
jgi:hypothetical protein